VAAFRLIRYTYFGSFTLDGVAQAPVTLTSGKARFSFSGLSVGVHTLAAHYSGDANFKPSNLATVDHEIT